MARHIDAYMNGVPISSVGDVTIQQVYEDAPTMEVLTGDRLNKPGQALLSIKRQTLRVTLEVAIKEIKDLVNRSRIIERLSEWCTGSILELSTRPDRRLHVICTAYPTLNQVRDYTARARIEFTAFYIPFWEDITAEVVTQSAVSGTAQVNIWVPGTADTVLDLTATLQSGTPGTFRITASSTGDFIALGNLDDAYDGNTTNITFTHDERDNLVLKMNNTSINKYRTGRSTDDLTLKPGANTLSLITYATSYDITFTYRGRWL